MPELRNLLRDTLEYLGECGKSVDDIHWIGSDDGEFSMTWEAFFTAADRLYDPTSKVPEVAADMVIVGLDWWMERSRSEAGWDCWDFKTKPMCSIPNASMKEIFVPTELDIELSIADLNYTGDAIDNYNGYNALMDAIDGNYDRCD